MGFVDWLRKFGILRYGTKKYKYTSGEDMPAEALMDNVYNAEKDLLIDDKQKIKNKGKTQKKPKKGVSMWKKVLGTIVVIIGIFVGLVMWGTSGMTNTANEFFILVKTKNYDDAYSNTSVDFQKSVSLEQFESFIKSSGLSAYKSVSWNSRSIDSNIGKLEGSVTTQSGDEIPIVMEFLKNGDTWKVFSISKKAAGIEKIQNTKIEKPNNQLETRSTSKIPQKELLIRTIQDSTYKFAQAVNSKTMASFYDNISTVWKEETSVEELNKVFKVFYDAGLDFTVLKNITPILDSEPIVDKENRLVLNGYYPTKPAKVYYKYAYIMEKGEWKLIEFNIRVK